MYGVYKAAINHSLQAGNLIAEVEAANIKRRLGNLERQRSSLNVQGGSLSALLTGMVCAQRAGDC